MGSTIQIGNGQMISAMVRQLGLIFLTGWLTINAQSQSDNDLARALAADESRQAAVSRIVESDRSVLPLLLEWVDMPPDQVDEHGLYIGLADVFKHLKAMESIPFLIANIRLRRIRFVDLKPWLKRDDVVLNTFPSLAALVNIGPAAIDPLIRAFREPTTDEGRLCIIFAVSSIASKSEDSRAREFLSSVKARANVELFWVDKGIKGLPVRP